MRPRPPDRAQMVESSQAGVCPRGVDVQEALEHAVLLVAIEAFERAHAPAGQQGGEGGGNDGPITPARGMHVLQRNLHAGTARAAAAHLLQQGTAAALTAYSCDVIQPQPRHLANQPPSGSSSSSLSESSGPSSVCLRLRFGCGLWLQHAVVVFIVDTLLSKDARAPEERPELCDRWGRQAAGVAWMVEG